MREIELHTETDLPENIRRLTTEIQRRTLPLLESELLANESWVTVVATLDTHNRYRELLVETNAGLNISPRETIWKYIREREWREARVLCLDYDVVMTYDPRRGYILVQHQGPYERLGWTSYDWYLQQNAVVVLTALAAKIITREQALHFALMRSNCIVQQLLLTPNDLRPRQNRVYHHPGTCAS